MPNYIFYQTFRAIVAKLKRTQKNSSDVSPLILGGRVKHKTANAVPYRVMIPASRTQEIIVRNLL